MIVYHGSNIEVSCPDLAHSRSNVDFGVGFYTTPLKEQAAKWCQRFIRRNEAGIISRYQLDDNGFKALKVLQFDSYSEDWLNFILKCRRGIDQSDYDIVMGGVANDKVFNTVELYFDGLIDKNEAIKRLRYEKPNVQLALRSEKAIKKYLIFEGSEKI